MGRRRGAPRQLLPQRSAADRAVLQQVARQRVA